MRHFGNGSATDAASEVAPLLRPDVAYDPAAALDWVEATFIPLLA